MTFPKSFQVGGTGSPSFSIKNLTAAYSVQPSDNGAILRITSGAGAITLPVCAAVGLGFSVVVTKSGGGICPINRSGTDTFQDTQTTVGLANGQTYRLVVMDASIPGKWQFVQAGTVGIGLSSISLGDSAQSTNNFTVAVGYSTTSSGNRSTAVGYGSSATADYSTAMGTNSSGSQATVVTGSGAMALGGSYASGTDSFAAANADNSGTYGAQGANSVAIGKQAKASATSAFAFGTTTTASSTGAYSLGNNSLAAISYKIAYAGGQASAQGDTQLGILILRASTTDGTATVATSDGSAASTINQVILTDNQAMTFNALITARQNTTGDTAAWNVSGCIKRGSGAGTTALVGTAVSLASGADTGAATWTAVCAADTTNGGLKITVTGQAAKTIRWSATVYTNELAG